MSQTRIAELTHSQQLVLRRARQAVARNKERVSSSSEVLSGEISRGLYSLMRMVAEVAGRDVRVDL